MRLSKEPDTETCPGCKEEFKRIAQHWSHPDSECTPPEVPTEVEQIVSGVFAVTGHKNTRDADKTDYLTVKSSDREKLEILRAVLGAFVTRAGVTKEVEEDKESGIGYDSYDLKTYRMRFKAHPQLQQLPDYNEITPTDLFMKTVFHLNGKEGKDTIRVSVSKNICRCEGIFQDLFDNSGNSHSEETGSDRIYFSARKENVKEILEMDWPRGWWNEGYLE